jgi:glycosyltransferase involved in cell wall biosynthesis
MSDIIRKADIVYLGSFNPFVFFNTIFLSKFYGKKLILGIHNPVLFKIYEQKSVSKFIFKLVLSRVGIFHVLNDYDKMIIRRNFPNAQIYEIPHFITMKSSRISTNKKDFIALYVGRLEVQQKGLDLLGKIIDTVISKNDAIKFYIAGRGGEGLKLIKNFKSEYPKNIKVLGFVSDKELKKQYRTATIFVLPSRYESFGLSLLEAQSNGLPAIAFDIRGPNAIITTRVQGRLVKPFDTEKFSDFILRYYNTWEKSKKELQMMKREIQTLIKSRYDYRVIIPKLTEMLK